MSPENKAGSTNFLPSRYQRQPASVMECNLAFITPQSNLLHCCLIHLLLFPWTLYRFAYLHTVMQTDHLCKDGQSLANGLLRFRIVCVKFIYFSSSKHTVTFWCHICRHMHVFCTLFLLHIETSHRALWHLTAKIGSWKEWLGEARTAWKPCE